MYEAEIKVCEKNKTMMGGKYCGGEWKINEEKMENVEFFMYLECGLING